MEIINQLQNIIKEYNEMDLLNITYKDLLRIEHCIEQLQLNHETAKIRIKSEILKEQDFVKLFVLNKDNYKELIPLKKLYKDKKGIYILSFSNGKVYVGQTNNLCRRLDEYFDINNKVYVGHNDEIRDLFKMDPEIVTTIYFLEAEQDRNLLESTYIEKFKATNPLYGYNKTGGNE